MAGADHSEVRRAAARARWGSTRPDRLAEEVVERADEISPSYRALLAALFGGETDDRETDR